MQSYLKLVLPYLLFESIANGERVCRLFGTVFKQIRAQRRAAPAQHQVVLDLRGQKDVVAVLRVLEKV